MTKLNIRRDIYATNELEVLVGETQTIIPQQKRRCPCGFLFKLLNGDLVVGGAMSGVDWPTEEDSMFPDQTSQALFWRRSKNRGQNWDKTPAWPTYAPYQFPNGEIIQSSARMWRMESDQDTYSTTLFRSTDDGYTFKKEKVLLFGIPELAKLGKHQYPDRERYANIIHPIVRLHNGNLLAATQGKFKNDIKERVFVIQSGDRSKTWNYLSMVTFDLTKDGIRPLGFDEPCLLVLPDGDILCFMRSGSKQGEPLYMSRSRDNGKSWSHADPIADRGVYPTACLMKNGVIVVVYGRPGDWLTFSLDQGKTWINHFCFNQTPEPYDCGNYDWIEEIAPDILLVIYSRTDPNDYMKSEIMGTYFTVKPRKDAHIGSYSHFDRGSRPIDL